MVTLNENYGKLDGGYLFREIEERTDAFLKKNPTVEIMKLGIGNTTEELASSIIEKLHDSVDNLAHVETYMGYGDEQGKAKLRELLVEQYARAGIKLEPSEIFVSDGAKPDSANIQAIFAQCIIAVQDPSYPVYVDSNVIAGRTGVFNEETGQYEGIVYMPCTKENGFFPEVPSEKVGLIYLCSPNNPTGAAATKEQLQTFVDYARENKAVIIFDAAYSSFITDPELPKSIYEIPGAKECAIEICSFSKSDGFTGLRLGHTVVPKDLVVENTAMGKVNSTWGQDRAIRFNGASGITQDGGIAALSEQSLEESQLVIDYYMENARIIKKGVESIGLKAYGGENAPYIWVDTKGMGSWDFFDMLLEKAHVVGTPGVGFGPNGKRYFRLSAFGHREDIKTAVDSIVKNLKI